MQLVALSLAAKWTGFTLTALCGVGLGLHIFQSVAVLVTENSSIVLANGSVSFVVRVGGHHRLTESYPDGIWILQQENLFRLRRASAQFRIAKSVGDICLSIPLWVAILAAVVLAAVSRWIHSRAAAYERGLCIKCFYDLRATQGPVCSECGSNIEIQRSWIGSILGPSRRSVSFVYFGIGLIACLILRVDYRAFWKWWPDWNSYERVLFGWCGPLALAVDFVAAESGLLAWRWLVGIGALALFGGLSATLLRRFFSAASLMTHGILAIAWFMLSPVAIGVVLACMIRG